MEAQLVGVSIYLDDKNIFYINRLHEGEKVSDESLKKFLQELFIKDFLIVGHNIKYDLEIIEMFMKQSNYFSQDSYPVQLSIL
jgi:DNA polymerase I-like protein with 3'-5' exonuclease and polymerase domains